MSKKIVFVHLLNDYSGSPKVLSQSIKALQSSDCHLEVMTNRNSKGFLSNLDVRYNLFTYSHHTRRIVTLFHYLYAQLIIFFKIFRYRKEDVTFYVNTLLPFGAALGAKVIGKPVIYHIHEMAIQPKLLDIFLKFVVKHTANKIIYVSKVLKDNIYIYSVPSIVIYNSIPDDFLSIAKTSIYEPIKFKGEFVVLMICSLKKYKGVDQFVKLARLGSKHSRLKFELVLNAEPDEINIYFDKNLPGNLSIYSRQNNLDRFYSSASLVLNLSLPDLCEETFGLTLIEGMAYGVPVIGPPVGGPTEIIANDRNGYLISSHQIEQIFEVICELSVDEARCNRLSYQCILDSKRFDFLTYKERLVGFINVKN